MQMIGRKIQLSVLLAAGVLFMATTLRPQAPGGGPAWQYCSVTTSTDGPRTASICYASPSGSGCRWEQINGLNQNADGAMAAAAKLGDQGWELVASTEAYTDIRRGRTLYFKRLKALDNREPFSR